MKSTFLLILSICLFLPAGCAMYGSDPSAPAAAVQQPKPLAIPLGKNWQLIEEAPQLSDERGTLPFQTDQAAQPERGKLLTPEEKRKLETNH